MYNDIQITQIVKTGLNGLINSANNETGSIIDSLTTMSRGLTVKLVNGQSFEIEVKEVE